MNNELGYIDKEPFKIIETKNNSDDYIIKNVIKVLEENIEYLIKVKNKFHYLGYFQDEELIKTKIESLKTLNNSIKK